MLEKMKIALRVKTNFFDEEILSVIGAARKELIRAGVKPKKANSDDDDLITAAIRAYVLGNYAGDTKLRDGYMQSFEYQKDCLRKSRGYRNEARA